MTLNQGMDGLEASLLAAFLLNRQGLNWDGGREGGK